MWHFHTNPTVYRYIYIPVSASQWATGPPAFVCTVWWIERWHLCGNAAVPLCPTATGSLLSEDVESGWAAEMAPSEANRPHGQTGHVGLCLGCIWAAGCPLSAGVRARLSWKSSCHFCCKECCCLLLTSQLLSKLFSTLSPRTCMTHLQQQKCFELKKVECVGMGGTIPKGSFTHGWVWHENLIPGTQVDKNKRLNVCNILYWSVFNVKHLLED